MRWIVCWPLVAVALGGCATFGTGSRGARPLLLVEGRTWNAPLLNPDPPVYGFGGDGGCIAQAEFRVEIDRLAYDSATGLMRIGGRLLDSSDKQLPPVGAVIKTRNGDGQPARTIVGPDSRFSLSLALARNPTISVERVAYRTLVIDLRKLSRRAARAPSPER